jgi:hypothetical protein
MLSGDELLQVHRGVMRRNREAVDCDFPAGLLRPGVQRGLQVHVLEHRQRSRHHGLLGRALAEVVAEETDDLVALPGARLGVHPFKERAERGRELAGLGIGGAGHSHWNDIQTVMA